MLQLVLKMLDRKKAQHYLLIIKIIVSYWIRFLTMEEMHSSQTLDTFDIVRILLSDVKVTYSLAMNDDIWQFEANMNSAIFDL